MSTPSLELFMEIAVVTGCVAVLGRLMLSVRGRRRSTVTAALNLIALALAAVGLYYIADRGESFWPSPWVEFMLKLMAITGIAVSALLLGRFLPRAVAFRDREALTQAAEELRQSKERFDRALRGATSGLWEWNIEANSIWYSPRYRELLGYEFEAEFPNAFESWEMAIHPDDREWVLSAVERHLRCSEDFEIEFRMKTNHSDYRWFSSKAIAIRGADGSPLLMSGSIQDIHEKKYLQQTTRKLDEYALQKHKMESLGELAGGIAHEFNNFLQAIDGQLQFIKRSLPESTEVKCEVDMATELLEQAARETRRLLAFGKQKSAQRQKIRPNGVLLQLKAVLGPLLSDHVKLHIKRGKHLGLISADSISIQQALVNLCLNARDAMPQGGTITLATEQKVIQTGDVLNHSRMTPGTYIGFTVKDTGHGISEEVQKRLFEPFFSTRPRDKGTGLGLSIVKSIIEEHGGLVDFKSEPGRGTTFKLWLPALRTPKVKRKNRFLTQSNDLKFTVLYVEDDRYIRRSIAHEFQDRGVRVVLARDGLGAVRVFEQCPRRIDLAVLDVSMPEMNGEELMRRIRKIYPDLPIVFCTAYAGILNDNNVLNEKNTYLVEKPFKFPTLWKTVQQAVTKAEMSDQLLPLAKGDTL